MFPHLGWERSRDLPHTLGCLAKLASRSPGCVTRSHTDLCSHSEPPRALETPPGRPHQPQPRRPAAHPRLGRPLGRDQHARRLQHRHLKVRAGARDGRCAGGAQEGAGLCVCVCVCVAVSASRIIQSQQLPRPFLLCSPLLFVLSCSLSVSTSSGCFGADQDGPLARQPRQHHGGDCGRAHAARRTSAP
jgi:hypothetical protein